MSHLDRKFIDNDPTLTGEALNALYAAVGWNGDGRRTPERSGRVLERAPYFVAVWEDGSRDGERLVGFGRILEDVYAAQIMDVMTHPACRRQGIARQVVARLVRHADRAALPLLLIAAGDATGLYQSFGFVPADPRSDVLMYRSRPEAG